MPAVARRPDRAEIAALLEKRNRSPAEQILEFVDHVSLVAEAALEREAGGIPVRRREADDRGPQAGNPSILLGCQTDPLVELLQERALAVARPIDQIGDLDATAAPVDDVCNAHRVPIGSARSAAAPDEVLSENLDAAFEARCSAHSFSDRACI